MKEYFLFLLLARSTFLAAHAKKGFNNQGLVEYTTPTVTSSHRHHRANWARENPQDSKPKIKPVTDALSDLDNTVCGVSPCDFEDISSNAIPAGDQFDAAIEGAKTFNQNGLNAHDYFYEWVGEVCGADSWDLDLDRVFGKLVDAPKARASSRGCFQKDEKTCKPDSDNEPPSTTSTTGNCKGKRDGVPCEIHIDKTVITASVPKLNTLTTTCEMKSYSQACFHYYSAYQNYPWIDKYFTCTDKFTGRADLPATGGWNKQHENRVWRQYTTISYTKPKTDINNPEVVANPECNKDEYPPGYFVPKGTKQDLADESGQLVRWLPGTENQGAGGLWSRFCVNHDGGEGNGQYSKKRNANGEQVINEALNELQKPGHVITNSNTKGGKTTYTTITQYFATYSNAVFALDFDWRDQSGKEWDKPSKNNDWYLRENPCWPKYIEPDNPGYVLLNNDKWYSDNMMSDKDKEALQEKLKKGIYKKAPKQDIINAANKRRKEGKPSKRDPDNFPIRDDFNITGGFPDDVQTEVINCQDAYCTEERKRLGKEEKYIYIPGKEPTVVTPSVNADTISTQGASTIAPATQPETRGRVVPEIPVPTGSA